MLQWVRDLREGSKTGNKALTEIPHQSVYTWGVKAKGWTKSMNIIEGVEDGK